jgi:hypothetical protein
MTKQRINQLPSQTITDVSKKLPRSQPVLVDDQQQREYAEEAYLIDGWQDDRRY